MSLYIAYLLLSRGSVIIKCESTFMACNKGSPEAATYNNFDNRRDVLATGMCIDLLLHNFVFRTQYFVLLTLVTQLCFQFFDNKFGQL